MKSVAVALGAELRLAVGRLGRDRVVLGRREDLALAVDRAAGGGVDDAADAGAGRRSSTLIVPSTLTRASKAGSATDLRTSIWAARWKTPPGPTRSHGLGDGLGVADVELEQLGAVGERAARGSRACRSRGRR